MEWVGTPFHHQGRLKGIGVDCAGVIVCIGRKFGVDAGFKDDLDYGKSPDSKEMLYNLRTYMTPIEIADALIGDVLNFAPINGSQHLGILMTDGDVIHASEPDGKVIRQNLSGWLGTKRIGAYRYKGL